jgi:surface antigen
MFTRKQWASYTRAPLLLSVAVMTLLTLIPTPIVHADSYDDRIHVLQQQNNQAQDQWQQLQQQAGSISAAIPELEAQITALQPRIDETTAKSQELQEQLAPYEAQLDAKRTVLSQNLRSMYIADDMSMLEKLASSKNLSEYVDREQYRVSMQAKIKGAMQDVRQSKAQLDKQKAEIDATLADQTAMQTQLQAQKDEKDRLLSLNDQQRAAQDQAIQANNAAIAQLQHEQAVANNKNFVDMTASNSLHGGYPWDDVGFPNSIADPWGMYMRQCVSYTAWRVAQSGRHMPYWGGRGNAKQWDDNAKAEGIPVDATPRVGDVAVSNTGAYGHVMYVEAVHDDGTVTISQYNANLTGEYSEGRRSTAGLVFIHFP